MTSGELRRPHLVVGAGGVAILPDIADVERMGDESGAHLVAKQAIQQILIDSGSVLCEKTG